MLGYTNLESEKGFDFFQKFMKENGILDELEALGIQDGDSKQRAYLKGLAMNITPIFQIGKSSLTPEFTNAVDEALAARELIKISVLQNCLDDPRAIAEYLSERTHSEIVQVIGKKIVLYREGKDKKKKIVLPER